MAAINNPIVTVNVSVQLASAPNNLLHTGTIVTQGGTTLAAGSTQIITQQSDLTAILATSGLAATLLQSAYTTFSANNSANRAVYVLELGVASNAYGTITLNSNPQYGAQANGTITLTGQPANLDTLDINGTTVTFVSGTPTGNQVQIGLTAGATSLNLQNFLSNSVDTGLSALTYSTIGQVTALTFKVFGTAGNSAVLTHSGSNITLSGAGTLTGGIAPDTVTVDGTAITFVSAATTGNTVVVAGTAALTAQNLYQFLINSNSGNIPLMTYAISGNVITATAILSGTGGNAYTLAESSAHIFVSGANLSGGGATATPASGIAQLKIFIANNAQFSYAWLLPNGWAADASLLPFLSNFDSPNIDAEFFFHVTSGNFTTYVGIKSAFYLYVEPTAPQTEFSVAAAFANYIGYAPSAANQLTPMAFKYLYGVTPLTNATLTGSLANTLKTNNVNYVGTGAQGGLSATILYWGTTGDGNDASWWYAVDWTQINVAQSLAAAIINGSNNPAAPLDYNQSGINKLQDVAQNVVNSAISFSVLNPPAVVAAVPYATYIVKNPNDYPNGVYNGLSLIATPTRGFTSITFYFTASEIPLA